MANNKLCYAVNGDPPQGTWKAIPDTAEARAEAIKNGAQHFSIYSFSADPGVEKNVVRYGDLVLDFDSHEGSFVAVEAAQNFTIRLMSLFVVGQEQIKYYLSGGKGCHLVIPAVLFGGEEGDPDLPRIHRRMVEKITNNFSSLGPRFDLIDSQLYSMGKGHILRVEDQRRANGRYKVALTDMEFFGITIQEEIDEYIKTPRFQNPYFPKLERNQSFHEFYLECLSEIKQPVKEIVNAAEDLDLGCDFFRHCKENAAQLSYIAWFAMLTNLVKLWSLGKELAHEYSKLHPSYSYEETEKKLAEADKICPYSCEKIKNEIFSCSRNCTVKFPYLYYLQSKPSTHDSSTFFHRLDGLYCAKLTGDGYQLKVCSPLEVIAYCRTLDGYGWGRIVRLTDPSGAIKTIVLAMSDIIANPEISMKKLLDCGLQLASYKTSKSLVLEYISTSTPQVFGTILKKCGWVGTRYVLKDVAFGTTKDELFVLENTTSGATIYTQGTLEEWKEHIGSYANGQPLLQLALSFALTGILLTPYGSEGGGLHIFGPSSCGKTTMLLVAQSIYGGPIKQWRATDNALESTAALHNDGFLALDEIGQASSKVVSEVAYMLVNGQAKSRANRDGNAKTILTWTLSFMSTGELTLSECIALDFGKETMAGQNVRVLDIPADAGTGHGVFTTIPDGMTGSSFSQLLVRNSKKYHGTPANAFIEKFVGNYDENVENLKTRVKKFIDTHMKDIESGQVIRAAYRFGLIAAAGELAIEWNIFPWKANDAEAAAIFGLNLWVNQRGGIGDQELTNAINRLIDFVEKNENRFLNLDDYEARPITNLAGYRWRDHERDEVNYGFIPSVFSKEICRSMNKNAVFAELLKRGWVTLNKAGNVKETKTVHGRNRKVISVVPARWEPEGSHDENHGFRMIEDDGTVLG